MMAVTGPRRIPEVAIVALVYVFIRVSSTLRCWSPSPSIPHGREWTAEDR
jgi:hypothetical protein